MQIVNLHMLLEVCACVSAGPEDTRLDSPGSYSPPHGRLARNHTRYAPCMRCNPVSTRVTTMPISSLILGIATPIYIPDQAIGSGDPMAHPRSK